MKTASILGLAFLLAETLSISSAALQSRVNDVEADKNLTKLVSEVLVECQKIKPGMTRAELLKIFRTEGGISTARHRTFVYRRCPYIKVDVDFDLSKPEQGALDSQPTDAIHKISTPYLAWSIID